MFLIYVVNPRRYDSFLNLMKVVSPLTVLDKFHNEKTGYVLLKLENF